MADTPTPRSYPQTLGDMFDAFLSKQGVKSLRVGGPIVSILEAAAQSDQRNAQDIFNLLTSVDLDNATGLALSRIGNNEGVPKLEISPATGLVTISDSSFTKIATKLFQGSPAPIVGSVTIDVVDASLFPAPGPNTQIYIGRNTSSYEGPIRYTAVVNVGNHWELTLAAGILKFHNTSETVILAQGGNRVVGPNTTVSTPQANTSAAVAFSTLFQKTLPDGETDLENVEVAAQISGNIGNIIAGSISEFGGSPPFDGATVTNPLPFTNGRETESDNDYRERIRDIRSSRQLATTTAIETAVTGITAPDENKRVNSASLVKRFGFPATLYIDDGTGYEESTAAIAIESFIDDAVGGETHFEATQRPIARAFAISTNVAPFVLRPTDQLTVNVGGITYTHAFKATDFNSITNASAFEVVSSINANPNIAFIARTANQGTQVIVFANADTNEDVEIISNAGGTDANDGLRFPVGVNYTMRLYKNDRLLSKDGETASIQSLPIASWDSVTGNKTIVVAVDNTPAITYEFTDLDFINAGTGYASLGRNSLQAWAAVINAKIPGITASVNAGRITLTSNAGPVGKAAVEIVGGDLVSAHFFPVGKVLGRARDYTLDRNEAQVVLAQILEAGDRLTAGSFATRAFIESDSIETINIVADAHLWWLVDGAAKVIPHGLTSATPLDLVVLRTADYGNIYRINSYPTFAFVNVQSQDWAVLWDAAFPASIRGVHRVASVDPDGGFFTIERHAANVTMRHGHASVLIPGVGTAPGKIFTCGGNIKRRSAVDYTGGYDNTGNIATSEIYDPATLTVTPAREMSVARVAHTATALANGKVVVVGGAGTDGNPLTSIEIYDSATDSWTTSAQVLSTPRQNHTATLLTDGRILIAGGFNTVTETNTYQVYSPAGDTIGPELTMTTARVRHAACLLPDNTVLVSGGYSSGSPVVDCERFTPGPDTFAVTGSMTVARAEHGLATVGLTPTTAIAVGASSQLLTDQDTWELYDIGAGTWSTYTSAGDLRFASKNIIRLTNGHVVGLDGWNDSDPNQSIGFTYDGTTFTLINSQAPSTVYLGGPRFDTQLVEIVSGDGSTVKNLVADVGGSFLHGTTFGYGPTAVFNVYNEPIDSWDAPDPADATNVTLSDLGIAFVRSNAFVQETTVPAGTNYTANSIADVLNSQLTGAFASVYKTTKLRVATNTFDASGDTSLATQDVNAAPVELTAGDAIANLVSHLGAVMSANSDIGTPSFEDVRVVSQATGTDHPQPVVTSTIVGHDYAIAGLKNWARGGDGTSTYRTTDWIQERANSNYKFSTRLKGRVVNTGLVSTLDTRDAPVQPWGPWDRVMAASPFAISPNGNLDVLVDNDQNKSYPVNFWRLLQPIGNTYASTNGFKDFDSNSAALSQTFGLDYDFDDFAIFMPSRALAFTGDANRRLLFRFFRLGPDGDGALVRFGNPDGENQPLTIFTNQLFVFGQFTTTIKLKSIGLRSPTVHNSTQVGLAVTNVSTGGTATYVNVLNLPIPSAARVSATTTYTLTLPAGITDHGIPLFSKVWVNSSDPNFPSGLKLISAVTTTTISCTESLPDATGTTIGTMSFDGQGEATFNGSSVAQYDFLRVNGTSYNSSYANHTVQVSAVPSDGYIETLSGDQIPGHFESVSSVLSWSPIGSALNFKVFQGAGETVTAIVAEINALRAPLGSTSPITATSTGTGSGIVLQNTCDEVDGDMFWYELSDGVNWVKTTNSPGSVPGDYTLDFKAPINADLSANADWENETVRIVPITTKNIVDWLNTPTVTGLWTVADIEAAGEGHHVEISTLTAGSAGGISVQGGLANSVTAPVVGTPIIWEGFTGNTVAQNDADALTTGMWCRIENENPQPKANELTTSGLVSWTADGLVTLDNPVANQVVPPTPLVAQFEKQGNFVAIADTGSHGSPFDFFSPTAGSWLRITPAPSITNVGQVQAANQGLFRIVRYTQSVNGNGGTMFIENPNVIEETAACQFEMYDPGSVMPGDQLVILSNAWGAGNVGIWDIKTVGETTPGSGDPFTVLTQFTVDITARRPAPHGSAPALDGSFKIYVREGLPMVYVMRINGLTLNQDDGNFIDIRWDKQTTSSAISEAAGSIIQVQDKLAFPQDFAAGSDGYSYDVGLIREANKVVYGDPGNPATYPGVAAADSHINIQGPLVKRIQIGVSIRVKTGLNTQDISNRVRSAIATVVNQTDIGTSISFSDIIDAAREVVGVVSVAIVSPLFSVESDQIQVQPYEKPYVLDLQQDVQVSFLGV